MQRAIPRLPRHPPHPVKEAAKVVLEGRCPVGSTFHLGGREGLDGLDDVLAPLLAGHQEEDDRLVEPRKVLLVHPVALQVLGVACDLIVNGRAVGGGEMAFRAAINLQQLHKVFVRLFVGDDEERVGSVGKVVEILPLLLEEVPIFLPAPELVIGAQAGLHRVDTGLGDQAFMKLLAPGLRIAAGLPAD